MGNYLCNQRQHYALDIRPELPGTEHFLITNFKTLIEKLRELRNVSQR